MSNDTPIRLRVDDETRVGVFATGLMVFSGPHEFVLDFTQNTEVPARVVARVAVPRLALTSMLEVVRQGVEMPPASSPAATPVSVGRVGATGPGGDAGAEQVPRNVYDDLKLPDAVQKGVYANALVTAHNEYLFRMDFVAQFCPEPVLTCRVFMTKADAAGLRATLEHVAGAGAK